jgi:hypothetical protein
MTIKMKTVNMIRLSDFDELVIKTYGRPYSFQQQDGCKSRGSYEFILPLKYTPEDYEATEIPEVVNHEEMGVSFKAWLEKDPSTPFISESWRRSLWWDRNFYPHVEMILDDLFKKGLLPKGDYVIKIDW